METVKEITKLEITNQFRQKNSTYQSSIEVIVIEDNQLTNMMMRKALVSTINTIQKLKNINIEFSCFHAGQ
ncbi:MAG: hypothetical protein LC658_02430, partial [Bacteroidales bacterium]|nr:hypothetical protein [Bacteroidales bacterium]